MFNISLLETPSAVISQAFSGNPREEVQLPGMPCFPDKCRNLTVSAPKSYHGKFKCLSQAIFLGSCFHQRCFSHHDSVIVLYTFALFEERFLPLASSAFHRVADTEITLTVFFFSFVRNRDKKVTKPNL